MRNQILLSALLGVASAASANPIRRVVTLLQNLAKETEAEGEREEELYKKFMCYCKQNDGSLAEAGKVAAAKGEQLSAALEASTGEKSQIDADLAQAKKDRAEAKADLAQATEIRKKEAAAFQKENAESLETIAATKGAIEALEKGTSFIQAPQARRLEKLLSSESSLSTDANDKQALIAFLSTRTGSSSEIVGILKNMLDEMDKDLGGVVSQEEAAVKAFKDLKAAKSKEIAALSESIEKKIGRSGELAVSLVETKNAIEDAADEAEENAKFLAELKKSCATKETEYNQRVAIRADEVSAISAAISVLNDDDALELFNKSSMKKPEEKPKAFLQTKTHRASAMAKLRTLLQSAKFEEPTLNTMSKTLLAQVRAEMKSGKVDFSKVIKMIDDMVTLLKTEGKDDEKHQSYCEAELDKAGDELKETKNTIESQTTKFKELEDAIAQLGSEIKASKASIASLDKCVADSTAQRKQEHEEYVESASLNEQALQLLYKAKNKLNKFYNPEQYKEEEKKEEEGDEAATSFVQVKQPADAPATFNGPYKKKNSSSVTVLMDKMAKDLEMDTKDAEHEEGDSQKDYEEMMEGAAKKRAAESKSIVSNDTAKAGLETTKQEVGEGLVMSKDQKLNVQQCIADLHIGCDFILKEFDARREQREREAESLKNAKAVLSGADFS